MKEQTDICNRRWLVLDSIPALIRAALRWGWGVIRWPVVIGSRWKLKLLYCGHLMQRADSLGKTLMLGKTESKRSKRRRERQRMVGWHHQLNGHEFEQIPGDSEGQRSLACCSPWGRKGRIQLSDWTRTRTAKCVLWRPRYTFLHSLSCRGWMTLHYLIIAHPVHVAHPLFSILPRWVIFRIHLGLLLENIVFTTFFFPFSNSPIMIMHF